MFVCRGNFETNFLLLLPNRPPYSQYFSAISRIFQYSAFSYHYQGTIDLYDVHHHNINHPQGSPAQTFTISDICHPIKFMIIHGNFSDIGDVEPNRSLLSAANIEEQKFASPAKLHGNKTLACHQCESLKTSLNLFLLAKPKKCAFIPLLGIVPYSIWVGWVGILPGAVGWCSPPKGFFPQKVSVSEAMHSLNYI